jgi:hypothetical protein
MRVTKSIHRPIYGKTFCHYTYRYNTFYVPLNRITLNVGLAFPEIMGTFLSVVVVRMLYNGKGACQVNMLQLKCQHRYPKELMDHSPLEERLIGLYQPCGWITKFQIDLSKGASESIPKKKILEYYQMFAECK